jgi:type III pantothenate kinase
LTGGRLETGEPVVYGRTPLVEQLAREWRACSAKNTLPSRIVLANVAGPGVLDAIYAWRDKALEGDEAVKERVTVSIENVVACAGAYGVKNAYLQPETLGADRWAALVAARHHLRGDACVIGCGTALTIDILNSDGEHQGGMIAPGWKMMENSLVTNTNGIISTESEIPDLLGKTTGQAVQAGVTAACAGAIAYFVQRCQQDMGVTLNCVVTGGAAPLLLPRVQLLTPLFSKSVGKFQHDPEWVLKGLAVIAEAPLENTGHTTGSGVTL